MTNKTVLSDAALIERIALDEKFQGACQRYAHNNGSSHAIATAAMQAVLQSPEIQQALADSKRIDWLADPDNHIGNVQLPNEVVESNLHSLRDAIDAAMGVKP